VVSKKKDESGPWNKLAAAGIQQADQVFKGTQSWIRDILVRIRIRASDQWIRLRILTFKTPTKNYFLF
jgi:hypothetical protein